MKARALAMSVLLAACSPQDPVTPALGVTILPVDAPPIPEPSASAAPFSPEPVTATVFQTCECDGTCETIDAFVARIGDDKLLACEADKRSGEGSGSREVSGPEARRQRVLDCFFPKSGTRLRLCPVAPQDRPDFNGYLRGKVGLPRSCFDSAKVRGSQIWGATEVTFRLDSGGYAQDVRVDTSDARLAKCVADGLTRVSFATHAGDVTRVRYRLVFDMPR
jgi:hypothetical protein